MALSSVLASEFVLLLSNAMAPVLTFFVVLVVLSAACEGQVTTDIDQCQLQCTPHQFISLLNSFTARVAQTETSIKEIRDRPDGRCLMILCAIIVYPHSAFDAH